MDDPVPACRSPWVNAENLHGGEVRRGPGRLLPRGAGSNRRSGCSSAGCSARDVSLPLRRAAFDPASRLAGRRAASPASPRAVREHAPRDEQRAGARVGVARARPVGEAARSITSATASGGREKRASTPPSYALRVRRSTARSDSGVRARRPCAAPPIGAEPAFANSVRIELRARPRHLDAEGPHFEPQRVARAPRRQLRRVIQPPPGKTSLPPIELTLMIRPQPLARIPGSASWVIRSRRPRSSRVPPRDRSIGTPLDALTGVAGVVDQDPAAPSAASPLDRRLAWTPRRTRRAPASCTRLAPGPAIVSSRRAVAYTVQPPLASRSAVARPIPLEHP